MGANEWKVIDSVAGDGNCCRVAAAEVERVRQKLRRLIAAIIIQVEHWERIHINRVHTSTFIPHFNHCCSPHARRRADWNGTSQVE